MKKKKDPECCSAQNPGGIGSHPCLQYITSKYGGKENGNSKEDGSSGYQSP